MRPINLIPKDQRRGDAAPSRTGAAGWVIVGALALAVLGAVLLVNASNTLSDREHEVAALQHAEAEAQRRAAELAPYTAFQQTATARKQTVAGLAASRFDWERVMRELALIVPDDIVIRTLTATVTPDVTVPGATGVDLRGNIPGPALELTGCGTGPDDRSQEAIARFISALYDIDGVTRVGMKDAVATPADEAAGAHEKQAGACAAGKQVSNFQIVAAFDSAPIPPVAGTLPEPPAEETAPVSDEQAGGESAAAGGQSGSTGASGATGATGADAANGSAAAADSDGSAAQTASQDAAAADTTAQSSARRAARKADKATDTFLPRNSSGKGKQP